MVKRTSNLEEDIPKKASLHSVKDFGEVNKDHKQVLMLFLALFLKQ